MDNHLSSTLWCQYTTMAVLTSIRKIWRSKWKLNAWKNFQGWMGAHFYLSARFPPWLCVLASFLKRNYWHHLILNGSAFSLTSFLYILKSNSPTQCNSKWYPTMKLHWGNYNFYLLGCVILPSIAKMKQYLSKTYLMELQEKTDGRINCLGDQNFPSCV